MTKNPHPMTAWHQHKTATCVQQLGPMLLLPAVVSMRSCDKEISVRPAEDVPAERLMAADARGGAEGSGADCKRDGTEADGRGSRYPPVKETRESRPRAAYTPMAPAARNVDAQPHG